MKFQFFVVILVSIAPTFAVTPNGTLMGLVRGAVGRPVPLATIRLTSSSRGFTKTVEADLNGVFTFQEVPPAPDYMVSASDNDSKWYWYPGVVSIAAYENHVLVPDFALPVTARAPAQSSQQSLDDLRKDAERLMLKPDQEGACDEFQQIDHVNPGYLDTTGRGHMKLACQAKDALYKAEAGDFNEGAGEFSSGDYEQAKEALNAALSISRKLKQPKFKDQIQSNLDRIDKFQECVGAYNQQNYPQAKFCFSQLPQSGDRMASDTNDYLTKISAKLTPAAPPPPPPKPAKPVAPSTSSPLPASATTSDDLLRRGLHSYFQGDYLKAEESLSAYLENGGSKRSLAYFFRGATHSSLFFLSGEKDSNEKAEALADFEAVKAHPAHFKPPKQYVSGRILEIYSTASPHGVQ